MSIHGWVENLRSFQNALLSPEKTKKDKIYQGDRDESKCREILGMKLSISLVSDDSNSTKGRKLANVKSSSKDLVTNLEGHNVALGLVTFGNGVSVETPLTTDFEVIKERIHKMEASGKTPFYKAMQAAYEKHLSKAKQEKVLVIDTDGLPSYESESTILDLGDNLKKEGITIITIGIGEDVNSSFLRRLASTPEDYYFAKAPKDIGTVFSEVTGSLVKKTS